MNSELLIALFGMLLIFVFGVYGRRKPTGNLAEWTVGKRNFGAATVWFLQAGEIFTAFTFLGLAGLAFVGGVSALYLIPNLVIAYIILFFVGPRVWKLGKEKGYLTQGDFLVDRYKNKALGVIAALFAILFLLPYLQLQITGLGLVIELVTGNTTSSVISMFVGAALICGFVLWAGVRGIARAAYFKDAIVLIVIVALGIAIPAFFVGGFGAMFDGIAAARPELLTLGVDGNGPVWFFTSALISFIGLGFLGMPFLWNTAFSAKNKQALRRNYALMPLFTAMIMFPVFIGFTAVLSLSPETSSNSALLTLTQDMLPAHWVGVVAIAALAASMVPAASMLMGISSLVARNVVQSTNHRVQFWSNHVTVVAACLAALLLAILRPDLLANLTLLTYAGLVQLTPAIALALWRERPVSWATILASMSTGILVVLTLSVPYGAAVNEVNVGIYGLLANLVVLAAGAGLERARRQRGPAAETDDATESDYAVVAGR